MALQRNPLLSDSEWETVQEGIQIQKEKREREESAAIIRELEEGWPDTPLTPEQEELNALRRTRKVISFQTTSGTVVELEKIARAKNIKLSDLLRRVIGRYLRENGVYTPS